MSTLLLLPPAAAARRHRDVLEPSNHQDLLQGQAASRSIVRAVACLCLNSQSSLLHTLSPHRFPRTLVAPLLALLRKDNRFCRQKDSINDFHWSRAITAHGGRSEFDHFIQLQKSLLWSSCLLRWPRLLYNVTMSGYPPTYPDGGCKNLDGTAARSIIRSAARRHPGQVEGIFAVSACVAAPHAANSKP